MPSAIRVTLSSNSRRRSYTVPIRGSSAVRYASMRSRTLGPNVWRWSKSPSTLDRRNALLDALEHGLAEAPLHHRVDRRALLLDEGLDARVQLFHAALHGHGEEREDLVELRQERGVQVAGRRRAELERADDTVLVEERR